MSALLEIRDLEVTIGNKTICQQFDLDIHRADRWAILGMNGTGKTTLLHTLAGLYPMTSGNIHLKGESLHSLSRRKSAQAMGLLLQDYEDNFPGTVLDMVLSGRHPYLHAWQWENADDVQRARDSLAQVGLNDFSDRQITTLSGGERRRVALAMLLTQSPDIYLMDEPTNHLDIHHQQQSLQLISELVEQQNKTVIMVLHDINLAIRYCDHALLLFEETAPLFGAIDEVMTEENLQRLFQHPLVSINGPNGKVFIPA